MNNITYEHIAPLVNHHETRGQQVLVIFTCPNTGTQVQSSARVSKERNLSNTVASSAQRSISYGIQNVLSHAIRDIFGYNIFGRVASDVARQTVRQVSSLQNNQLSKTDIQRGIVLAFESVNTKFMWDGNRYVLAQDSKQSISLFSQQISSFPIDNSYDKKITMLAFEIGCSQN